MNDFFGGLPADQEKDCHELVDIFETITGYEPVMWGPSVIGFGQTGKPTNPECACDGLEIGFAPRDGRIFLYLRRFADHYAEYIDELGDVQIGKASISFPSLDVVDRENLMKLLTYAWEDRSRAR
ncbi:MAG: DUF1801 domain-containing protein [Actinomycetaceae bacterium]|nr:DUF1801 domain-containing protein [Actinomycetaceae bacterium]